MEKVASTGALFLLMYLGERAQSHAVLPAFLLGLARARTFERRRVEQQRFRVLLPLPSRGAGEIGRCALAQQDERFVDGPGPAADELAEPVRDVHVVDLPEPGVGNQGGTVRGSRASRGSRTRDCTATRS
jgi:hypothetical protein